MSDDIPYEAVKSEVHEVDYEEGFSIRGYPFPIDDLLKVKFKNTVAVIRHNGDDYALTTEGKGAASEHARMAIQKALGIEDADAARYKQNSLSADELNSVLQTIGSFTINQPDPRDTGAPLTVEDLATDARASAASEITPTPSPSGIAISADQGGGLLSRLGIQIGIGPARGGISNTKAE